MILFPLNIIAQNIGSYCPCKAPIIVSQPISVNAPCASFDTIRFSVAASGTTPLYYQWQENGINIMDNGTYNGATKPNLDIVNPPSNLNGRNYKCLVFNCTNVTLSSTSCILSINVMPTDFNADGGTDIIDFSMMLQIFNNSCIGCKEDINKDGVVDVIDFLILIGRFNQNCY